MQKLHYLLTAILCFYINTVYATSKSAILSISGHVQADTCQVDIYVDDIKKSFVDFSSVMLSDINKANFLDQLSNKVKLKIEPKPYDCLYNRVEIKFESNNTSSLYPEYIVNVKSDAYDIDGNKIGFLIQDEDGPVLNKKIDFDYKNPEMKFYASMYKLSQGTFRSGFIRGSMSVNYQYF
tara:strand:+ start:6171 stop:6710 length:540 start_codon:yes stop_codon:yes gene_type:complete